MDPLDQRLRIWKKDWKYLIILDACRYDYFQKIYREYLTGKLEKVRSPGSMTTEWLDRVFSSGSWNDVVYISANPYINSKRIPWGEPDPKKHFGFFKIIDVWDWGWNDELGTVHPREVNKAAILAVKLYKYKRFIIHYMQPHYPYLSLASKGIKINEVKMTKKGWVIRRSILHRVKGFIRWKIVYPIWGYRGVEFVNKLIGYPPDPLEFVARKIGTDGLRRAYEDNLRIVLKYVSKLIKHLRNGKIIITADHGELLGERGAFGHTPGIPGERFPELVEVPWLEIENV